MWQKEDEDIQWNRKSDPSGKTPAGPHPDYDANLLMAQNFISRTKSALHAGMSVSVSGSHGLDRSMLTVAFNAGRYVAYANWAHSICLHQPKQTFAKSLEIVFNDYVRKAQKFESGAHPHG